MVLTGRVMSAEEALGHGVVSRVVPADQLDTEVRSIAEKIAEAPPVTVWRGPPGVAHLALPELFESMDEEMIAQTFIARSDDMAEMRAARAEGRAPVYRGS